MRLEQARDQLDVPGQPGLRGKVIEVKRDFLVGRRLDDGGDISGKPIVRNAFIVERRQYQRARKAKLRRMPRQRDGVGGRGRTGADHQPIERQACGLVGRHHGLALLKRERGRFAGGAEHIEAVAAGVEQEARELGGARGIRRAGLVDRGGNGGDDAGEFVGGHGGSSRGE
jgi:hypothetical protein